MIGSIKLSNSNGSSAMYEREDAFTNLLKPMLNTLDACERTESHKQEPAPRKRVRYVQLTAEEYAAEREAKAERERVAAEEARQAKSKKSFARCVASNGKPYTRTAWEEWEEYCLSKFVSYMTPEEVAKSLDRPTRGVKAKSYAMGLKWKYSSEQAKRRILAKEASKRTEAQIVAHVNSAQSR